MVKESVKITIKDILSKPRSLLVTLFVTLIVMALYIWAIELSASLDVFFNANSTLYVVLQLLASFINSFLVGLSIAIFVEVFKKQKNGDKSSIFETLIAIIFSVGTTGCYVCGSLLLPVVGLTASLASLPLGGLEIKILTILLLVYSIVQSSKTYAGICEIKAFTNFRITAGQSTYRLSTKRFIQLRPFIIIFIFSVLIFIVPSFFTGSDSLINTTGNGISCPISHT